MRSGIAGTVLKSLLDAVGVSVAEAAEAAGVTPRNLYYAICDKSSLSEAAWRLLCVTYVASERAKLPKPRMK